MPSKLKSDTARINGAKSRGPTTPAGLAKSSRNALKHGLTADVMSGSAIVLACEVQEDFDKIFGHFFATYKPANPAEEDLVEEMVAARWRIRRLWTIETCMLDAEILKQESISTTGHPGINLALAFRSLADESRSLALSTRYESRLHRIYDHAYATLRELQQLREPVPPGASEPAIPAATPGPDPEPPTSPPEPPAPSVQEELRNEPTDPPTTTEALTGNQNAETPLPAQHPTSNIHHPVFLPTDAATEALTGNPSAETPFPSQHPTPTTQYLVSQYPPPNPSAETPFPGQHPTSTIQHPPPNMPEWA